LKPSEVDVLKTAERFVAFVNGNKEVQFTKEWKDVPLEVKNEVLKKDDLPF